MAVPKGRKAEARSWRPQDVEARMYAEWEAAGYFTADPASEKPKFSIVLPPPNITGELHMGHATNHTVQDVYCRYKRLRGYEVLWLPGTDHAALATNAIIERQLAAEGTSKEKIGRAAFDKRVNDWYANYGARILVQERRLGLTCDWSRTRFTMDAAYVKAVREAFVRLYNEGYIYRGPRIVNWCPNCQSSISDLEIDWREHEDTLYHIRYEMADGVGALNIATVRPETMLADTAVAVNPDDERYRHFVGKSAILPIVGRELPVVADAYVDVAFGTGALKVTPGHDPNDYEIGQRHGLEVLSVIEKDGTIASADYVPDELRSLSLLDARRRIVDMLRETGHLEGTEPYVHEVGHCDRCGEVIEPLVDEQWWCAMKDLAAPAIRAVESGPIKFTPAKWTKSYLDWMRNLKDWNVSRQIWLGHRIPVYYCDAGHGEKLASGMHADSPEMESAFAGAPEITTETYTFASVDEPAACPVCGGTEIRQDPDVLDTWFSSALWPFATMGWPDAGTPELRAFYPTQVLGTAAEIIYLWVARMIMTSLKFMDTIPFDTVLIHTTVLAADGSRMSKSKGNGVDPVALVDKYGADAVRAWCTEVALPRQDVRFNEVRIDAYMRFATKLWNMRAVVQGGIEGVHLETPVEITDPFDRWILSRLAGVIEQVEDALEGYRPGEAISTLRDFAWSEVADWYLEVIKPRLRLEPDDRQRIAAARTALVVLDCIIRMAHPFMPFVTEAIWSELVPGREPLLARHDSPLWPASQWERDEALEIAVVALMEAVTALRDARKDLGFQPQEKARVGALRVAPDAASDLLDSPAGRAAVEWLARVEFAHELDAQPARSLIVRGLELTIAARDATAGFDRSNLRHEREKVAAEVERLRAMLANGAFVERAKPDVVQKTRDQLADAEQRLVLIDRAVGA